MNFVKFFTNYSFDNDKFADVLNAMHVAARAVGDGVILDQKELNKYPSCVLPVWVRKNIKDINSIFHTRPATKKEIAWALEMQIKTEF